MFLAEENFNMYSHLKLTHSAFSMKWTKESKGLDYGIHDETKSSRSHKKFSSGAESCPEMALPALIRSNEADEISDLIPNEAIDHIRIYQETSWYLPDFPDALSDT